MRETGDRAEELALEYLLARGLVLVARNASCRYGEIDLVLRTAEVLVFVEVKYRKDERYTPIAQVVDAKKRLKIMKSALFFMQGYPALSARFDVVLLTGDLAAPTIEWLVSAFDFDEGLIFSGN